MLLELEEEEVEGDMPEVDDSLVNDAFEAVPVAEEEMECVVEDGCDEATVVEEGTDDDAVDAVAVVVEFELGQSSS